MKKIMNNNELKLLKELSFAISEFFYFISAQKELDGKYKIDVINSKDDRVINFTRLLSKIEERIKYIKENEILFYQESEDLNGTTK